MTTHYAEVIGDPVAHSKSPLIHNFWLQKCGINALYSACCIMPGELGEYIAARCDDPAWRGCNVTLPHKIAVMDYVKDRGDVRATIGAMNTVFRANNALIGTNTDAAGFYTPLADTALAGGDAIVVGSGGAAHAVLFALARVGIGTVTLLVRDPLKGAALLTRFGLKGKILAMNAILPSAQLLVNTTSLGMTGRDPLLLDLSPLPSAALVYDIVYSPLQTPLLAAATARGLETIDGLEMLVGQAALAFELFFGQPAPREHDGELRALLTA